MVAGSLVVVLSPAAGALAGAVLWGLGASLGFPLGMSAAADEAARSAARVSVVGSIGYTAFLGGPPLVGLLADHVDRAARDPRRLRGRGGRVPRRGGRPPPPHRRPHLA